jgi:hypothetical protein
VEDAPIGERIRLNTPEGAGRRRCIDNLKNLGKLLIPNYAHDVAEKVGHQPTFFFLSGMRSQR